jgi:hypothetical protein
MILESETKRDRQNIQYKIPTTYIKKSQINAYKFVKIKTCYNMNKKELETLRNSIVSWAAVLVYNKTRSIPQDDGY